jgi:hypothetical protein
LAAPGHGGGDERIPAGRGDRSDDRQGASATDWEKRYGWLVIGVGILSLIMIISITLWR